MITRVECLRVPVGRKYQGDAWHDLKKLCCSHLWQGDWHVCVRFFDSGSWFVGVQLMVRFEIRSKDWDEFAHVRGEEMATTPEMLKRLHSWRVPK